MNYKLGSATGSLVNYVIGNSRSVVPEVGMGATLLCWSDRHAATVVSVEQKGTKIRIGVVEDEATRTDSNGMSESQEYTYAPGKGSPTYFTLRKDGAFVREGEPLKGGQRVRLGEREEYHDFSF